MQLFEKTGAYLKGHFRLTSGLHSPEYLQCAKVLAHPAYAEELGRELARRLRQLTNRNVDVVLAPALGGLIIGHEVARELGAPFLFHGAGRSHRPHGAEARVRTKAWPDRHCNRRCRDDRRQLSRSRESGTRRRSRMCWQQAPSSTAATGAPT